MRVPSHQGSLQRKKHSHFMQSSANTSEPYRDLCADGSKILKWILEKQGERAVTMRCMNLFRTELSGSGTSHSVLPKWSRILRSTLPLYSPTEQYVILHVMLSRTIWAPSLGGSMNVWQTRHTVRVTRTNLPLLLCWKTKTISDNCQLSNVHTLNILMASHPCEI
jgi:hypothetical protein